MKYKQFYVGSSANQHDTIPIEGRALHQIVVPELFTVAGHANDTVRLFAPTSLGKTTVSAAVVSAGVIINLVGDASVKNTLNGVAVEAADFVLLYTDSGMQMFEIGTVDAGGADAVITIDAITFYDGKTSFDDDVAAGNAAYVIWAEEVSTIATGSVSTATLQTHPYPFAGNLGSPIVLDSYGGDAAAHYISGLAEYGKE